MPTVKTPARKVLDTAFRQAIEERKDIFYDVISDVMEDIALGRAIEEGLNTKRVSKEEVLKAL